MSGRELVRRARPAPDRGPHLRGRRMEPVRRPALEGLTGTVVELGFGSGPNVGLYPDAVDRVLAVEPSEGARALARKRMAGRAHPPIDFVGLDGATLPVDDGSADAVLSTFTLCTIPDIDAAMAEIVRVLRPGGRAPLRRARAQRRPGGVPPPGAVRAGPAPDRRWLSPHPGPGGAGRAGRSPGRGSRPVPAPGPEDPHHDVVRAGGQEVPLGVPARRNGSWPRSHWSIPVPTARDWKTCRSCSHAHPPSSAPRGPASPLVPTASSRAWPRTPTPTSSSRPSTATAVW